MEPSDLQPSQFRIFGRKTEQPPPAPQEAKPRVKKESQATVRYVRKTVSKLKSINFVYRKVEGLSEKCRQLVSTPYGILAATNKGLYVIRDHKSATIIPDKYINYIRWLPFNGIYYIATSEGCFFVRYENNIWKSESLDRDFSEPVYSVTREDSKTIWLGGDNFVTRVELNEAQTAKSYTNYKINKEYPDRYILKLIYDTLYLFTESEIHYYDRSADKFEAFSDTGSYFPLERGTHLSM